MEEVNEKVVEAVEEAAQTAEKEVSEIKETVEAQAEAVEEKAAETVEEAADKAAKAAEDKADAASDVLAAAVETAKEVVEKVGKTVQGVVGIAQEAGKTVKENIEKASENSGIDLKAAEEKVKETIKEIGGKVHDAVETAMQKASETKEAAQEQAAEVSESMDDFKDELEESYRKRKVKAGDIMNGTVTSVNEKEVYVDLGYASGRIAAEDMSNDPSFSVVEQVKVGDPITGAVLRADDGEGNIRLSKKKADDILAWERLKTAMAEKKAFHGKISNVVKGGAVIYVEGIRGFMPASRMDLSYVEDTASYQGKEVDFRVVEVHEEDKRVILSAREPLRDKANEEKKKRMQKFVVGTVLEGKVESLKDYGAFVDLGDGVTGLLHVSQISDRRIKTPSQVLKEGDVVKVRIIKAENGRISLSMKEASSDAAPKETEDEGPREYKDAGSSITTGLGALLKGLKLD